MSEGQRLRRLILLTLAPVLLLPFAGSPVSAAEKIDLMGEWVVKPYRWYSTGCLYRQWVSVERRAGPNRYSGTARWQHDCGGTLRAEGSTPVTLTVRGKQVRITSDRPSWMTETLRYLSPTRMKGRDPVGQKFIYERPKGRPGV